jgi:class 3 adenylate cyclase
VIAERLVRIGADPSDDDETRLDKLLVLSAAAMIAPLALVWGAIYLALGAPRAAAIPWLYVLISVASVALFAVHRSFRLLAACQLVPFVLLPFALMWDLGGFATGSAVALWALFAPLAALVVSGPRAAAPWLVVFVALLVASAFVEHDEPELLSAPAVEMFFVLNLGAVTVVAFALVSVLLGGRDATLDAVRGLVRRYFSPAVASTLLAEPDRLELGGEVVEVTVLFADLRGFTAASERVTPDEAVALLNRYFAVALPIVEAQGGTPIQLAGDQVMAVFNAPDRHEDHPLRGARAGLEIQRRVDETMPEGPRFGIGINTGPALVGNIGSESFRNFTAAGDTTNLAARLSSEAGAGEVVLGAATAEAVRSRARLTARPALKVKGKAEPVEAFVLEALS